jgi:hypothetical protein
VLIANVDLVLRFEQHAEVNSVQKVSEVLVASIFSVEIIKKFGCSYRRQHEFSRLIVGW